MGEILVTVLMPVYNGEKYLRQAIDSILNQTLTAFEFLIIDDGSTDSSVSLIKSYSDPRIRFIENTTNLGISATLNKGIALSTTELIARMDADDISYPERLEKQYIFFTNNPDCALLSSWTRVVSEDIEHIKTEKYQSRFYYYNLTFSCWIYHPAVMYKKAAVLDVGGYKSMYAEDYDLFWHMIRKYRFDNIEEVLLDYRITSKSLHQVTKKTEYDQAMDEQILRNIRYYTGDAFSLSYEEFQCLRFDFVPILHLNSTYAIWKAFKKLRIITQQILKHPNPNLNKEDVLDAWHFRKRHMILYFSSRLPVIQKLFLKAMLLN